ncbi:MAG: hypothetical protein KJO29_09090 [Bacteroidia bacterium]|nr:hypothetical protein [Bacteroidia bacterium]
MISCNNLDKPVFKKIKDVNIVGISEEGINFSAVAVHYNPNPVSGTIDESIIHVMVNEIHIGTIDQQLNIDVLAYENFEYDFEFTLNHKEFMKGKDILDKLYSVIYTKKLMVDFTGDTKCKFVNIPFSIPIRHQEIIELNI